jgi:hypothetical protein
MQEPIETPFARASQVPLPRAAPGYLPAYDLYGPVHKGLRYALAELSIRFGTCPVEEPGAVDRMLDDLEGLFYLLVCHAAHEDERVHAAIEARAPGAATRFAAAHARQERMLAELRELICAVASATPESFAGHWRTLALRFAALTAEHLAHMSEEEEYAQPLLERLYSLEELEQLHAAVLADIGPDEMLAFQRVMIAGSAPAERVQMLRRVTAVLDTATRERLLDAVRRTLPPVEYQQLVAKLHP